jgi:anti-sigma regulatory factor (Ser/Thr protein kinase)
MVCPTIVSAVGLNMSCDSCKFDAASESVSRVRRFVGARLSEFDANVAADVVLMTSELATNAIRHGGTDIEVTLMVEPSEGLIRVEVRDGGDGEVARTVPGAYADRGRGLQIVDQLSDRWGMREVEDGPGKTVWFVMIEHPRDSSNDGGREMPPQEALKREHSPFQPSAESVR